MPRIPAGRRRFWAAVATKTTYRQPETIDSPVWHLAFNDEVASITGWQRHTVRGVFSGTLKKKLGLTLASAKEERGRVYRIDGPSIV